MKSFGSGTHVKLPGPAPDRPNIYDFNTSYDEMYRDLLVKDKALYPGWECCYGNQALQCGLEKVLPGASDWRMSVEPSDNLFLIPVAVCMYLIKIWLVSAMSSVCCSLLTYT